MENEGYVATPDTRIETPRENAAPPKRRRGWLIAVLIIALLALSCGALLLAPQFITTIYGRTSVLGVDMSHMTMEQARAAWEKEGATLCDDTRLALVAEGETMTECSLTELGISIPAQSAALEAWNAGHGGSVLDNAVALVRSFFAF